MAWLYVPGVAVLRQDYTSSCQDIALSVLLSGKPTLRPASWSGWSKRAWARVLCGMTLPPLTLRRGVVAWISSLLAIRASHTVRPDAAVERVTAAIYGLTSMSTSKSLCRRFAALKTSQGTLLADSPASARTWNAWATELRRDYSARRSAARRMQESGFFALRPLEPGRKSSQWGTPTARDHRPGRGMAGQLPTQIQADYGPRDVASPKKYGRHRAWRLNPAWVEQLMGWATGQSSCTCSATEWCQWLRRWRLLLFGRDFAQ